MAAAAWVLSVAVGERLAGEAVASEEVAGTELVVDPYSVAVAAAVAAELSAASALAEYASFSSQYYAPTVEGVA